MNTIFRLILSAMAVLALITATQRSQDISNNILLLAMSSVGLIIFNKEEE
jgi:hypothetical protein